MKNLFPCRVIFLLMLLTACNQNHPAQSTNVANPILHKIIAAHGGITRWNQQRTLSFTVGGQKQTIDLKTRDIKISSPQFSMGSKNGNVWLQQDSANFKGSPRFYHSLMFYFHTMPFVFADDGINYQKSPAKTIKGKKYRALKMSFDKNVGDAPKDVYILYYDPKTYKMKWLAYSSTFHSQKQSDDFNMIHYKKWKKTDGFLLPTKLQWYGYKNGTVGAPRGPVRKFTDKTITEKKKRNNFYAIPKGAMVDSASTK